MHNKLNPNISYKEKNKVTVVYYRFNFYFLKNEAAAWFKFLIKNKNVEKVPPAFIRYLRKKRILL